MIDVVTTYSLLCDGARCDRQSEPMPSEDEALHAAVLAGWYVSSHMHLCPDCCWRSKAAVRERATLTKPKEGNDA